MERIGTRLDSENEVAFPIAPVQSREPKRALAEPVAPGGLVRTCYTGLSMNRPRSVRLCRIAALAACLMLLGLWILRYWRVNQLSIQVTANRYVGVASGPGAVAIGTSSIRPGPVWSSISHRLLADCGGEAGQAVSVPRLGKVWVRYELGHFRRRGAVLAADLPNRDLRRSRTVACSAFAIQPAKPADRHHGYCRRVGAGGVGGAELTPAFDGSRRYLTAFGLLPAVGGFSCWG